MSLYANGVAMERVYANGALMHAVYANGTLIHPNFSGFDGADSLPIGAFGIASDTDFECRLVGDTGITGVCTFNANGTLNSTISGNAYNKLEFDSSLGIRWWYFGSYGFYTSDWLAYNNVTGFATGTVTIFSVRLEADGGWRFRLWINDGTWKAGDWINMVRG